MRLKQIEIYLKGWLSVVLLFGSVLANAQSEVPSIFDDMHFQEVLEVTLTADFQQLDTARRNPHKFPGTLRYVDAKGTPREWPVKLKQRGNFRRLRCEMVPLKIEFKKKDLRAAGLADFDDMKLVTHCVSNKSEARALVQKEYLAYRLYNELTEMSYRVQLLKINYVDSNSGDRQKRWAFLIEDSAQLEHRIGASEKVENGINLPRDTFHGGLRRMVATYQYMIGNSDWDVKVGRNLKFYAKNGKVIPVPYDFDFSGFVDAPYAIPNPNYLIESVRDRIYLGFPKDLEHLNGTLSYFKTKRSDLLEKIDAFHWLSADSRQELIAYIDHFYQTMRDIQPAVRRSSSMDSTAVTEVSSSK